MGKAIRQIYGEALAKYGLENEKVVVLDADVSNSSRSGLFGEVCPERFFNVGIAEANMVAMAAGMAAAGMIPFANTFSVFMMSSGLLAARTYGSYSKVPIRLVGGYSGMSDSFDGPSHHAVEDMAIMRALPNFQVFVACDKAQVDWLVRYAIATPQPMYLRMSRDVFPEIYPEGEHFECGRGKILHEGADAVVFACGLMVSKALDAAALLEQEGISLRVVDMFCVKPIDRELVLQCAKETGAVVSAEEHSVIGGLGSAISEVLVQGTCNVPMEFVGISDCHGECGPYSLLQKKYGFDVDAVCDKVRRVVERK